MDYGPVALILVFVFLAIVLLLLSKTGPNKNTKRNKYGKKQAGGQSGLSTPEYRQHWQRIEELLATPGTDATRTAVMEADKLVDMALKQKNFKGQTMGERLKDAQKSFDNNAVYQGLWQAHKMRNALAHELNFELPKPIARQHLDQFKAALRQMGIL